jgi:radical SAM protein with 4Fe4S-binding SPASM domain
MAGIKIGNELLKKFKGEFDKIIANIQYVCEQNRRSGSSCMIGAQLLINPTNIHEVISFTKLMKELGCDYCVIKPYSQHHYSLGKQDKLFGGFTYQDCLSLGEQVQKLSGSDFNVIFRSATMENYEDSDRHYAICQATPMAWGYIMATGEFVSCSAYLPQDVGVGDQRFVLGNINTQSFQEIWEGEKRKRNWEFVNNELDITECRKNCRMDAVNRFLWDEIKDTKHDELDQHFQNSKIIPLRNVNFI